ncbi:MAG: substrate-binding domain-containing protein [Candidatus Bathyarchaeota archaeon]
MTSKEYSLHVFSAGAVATPLQEAIALFEKKFGVYFKFSPGSPEILLATIAAEKEGDVISTGAEYILERAGKSLSLLLTPTFDYPSSMKPVWRVQTHKKLLKSYRDRL